MVASRRVAMKHMPQVIAVMTPFPHTVNIDDPLSEAVALMRAHDFRHLPVVEHGTLRGVLTERDVRTATASAAAGQAASMRVRDAFHDDAYTVEADMPLDRVAAAMAERHVGSALVTKAGKLVGVFTGTDACRALAQVLRERFPPPQPGQDAA
jgi:acetoin utilization protein AcuB